MAERVNISSAVVHARPGTAAQMVSRLEAIAGVEVHATATDGRLVVSIESEGERELAEAFAAIGRLAGVLSVALVYARVEADPDAELNSGSGLVAASQRQGGLQ